MRALWSPGWIARHVLTVVIVAGFLWLGWWQLGRAAGGNTLSWAYTIQWPVFAGFVVFVWYREVRHSLRVATGDEVLASGAADPEPHSAPLQPRLSGAFRAGAGTATGEPVIRRPVLTARRPQRAEESDPTLAAYNDYLAWLAANPGARTGDYPGTGRWKE